MGLFEKRSSKIGLEEKVILKWTNGTDIQEKNIYVSDRGSFVVTMSVYYKLVRFK